MNNNVSVNELNASKNTSNVLSGLENSVCTIKCIASTTSIDSSGDYRVTRRLECLAMNQGIGTNNTILDLEISGSKGTTPVVTVNGQVIPGNSLALDASGNLEVRSFKGMLLDIVKLPNEYSIDASGFETQSASSLNAAPGYPATKPFLGLGVKPVSADLAHNLAMDAGNVCVISEVIPGSPAFVAGLEPNDVILGVNGKPANLMTLWNDLKSTALGQSLKLEILCKGVTNEVDVTPGTFGWATQQPVFDAGFGYPVHASGLNGPNSDADVKNPNSCTNGAGYPFGSAYAAGSSKTSLSAGTLI